MIHPELHTDTRPLDNTKSGVIIIDNHDSFTYNLVHMVEELVGAAIPVRKNDAINLDEPETYEYILLSPGPGLPGEAGLLREIITRYGPHKKILGVCLGMQAICEVYGGSLKNLDKVYHGMSTTIIKTDIASAIFTGLNDSFPAGRYHSWAVDDPGDALRITARDEQGEIMALQHKAYHVYGVQFHPESIMTPDGIKIIENFLNIK